MACHHKSLHSQRNLMVFDLFTLPQGHKFLPLLNFQCILVYRSSSLIWYATCPCSEKFNFWPPAPPPLGHNPGRRMKIPSNMFFFVWFDSLRPINNLSVIKGSVFLCWTSTKLGLMFLLKDTTQWRRWGSNPQPLGIESSTLPLSHCAPSIQFVIENNDIWPFCPYPRPQGAETKKLCRCTLFMWVTHTPK